jgi:hypothetical protein
VETPSVIGPYASSSHDGPVCPTVPLVYNLDLPPGGAGRQIFLALDSNSCHNINKLEQKFIVRTLGRPNWCNCFTAPKALQVTQDLP